MLNVGIALPVFVMTSRGRARQTGVLMDPTDVSCAPLFLVYGFGTLSAKVQRRFGKGVFVDRDVTEAGIRGLGYCRMYTYGGLINGGIFSVGSSWRTFLLAVEPAVELALRFW